MATLAQRARFKARVRSLIAQRDRLDDRGRASAAGLLRDLKRELDGVIGRTDFSRASQQAIRREVATLTDDFARRYTGALGSLEKDVFELAADWREKLTGLPRDLPDLLIPTRTLNVAQGFRADLIVGMKDEIVDRVSREISLGTLAGESPFQIQDRIRRFVTPIRRSDGTTIGALARAETIARTEMNRIFTIAAQAQQGQDVELLRSRGEEPRKTWITAGDDRVRESHAEAGQRYGPGGDPGPIPVDEPYIVDGEPLMYPRDPSGTAGNTILCRCDSVLVTESILEMI